jgi:hypothetical protein
VHARANLMATRKQPQTSEKRAAKRVRRPTQGDNIDRSSEAAVDHNPRAMKPAPADALPVRRFTESRRRS